MMPASNIFATRLGAQRTPVLTAHPAQAGSIPLTPPAQMPQGAPGFSMMPRPQMGMPMPQGMTPRPQMPMQMPPGAQQNAMAQRLGMAF